MEENLDLAGVKSSASVVPRFVTFINCSDRKIAVFWINYAGLAALYTILNPKESVNVNTFVGHPWISIDVKTKERFLTGGRRIFYPSSGLKNILSNVPIENVRLIVKISPPLRELKMLSYMCLVKMLSKEEDVDPLDLPLTLQKELKKLIKLENRFENTKDNNISVTIQN